MRLNSYDGDDGDDDDDCVGVDVDDDINDGDDDASCATLALRSCIITAGCRPTHAISISYHDHHHNHRKHPHRVDLSLRFIMVRAIILFVRQYS